VSGMPEAHAPFSRTQQHPRVLSEAALLSALALGPAAAARTLRRAPEGHTWKLMHTMQWWPYL
jgi:hypothetical protein